MQKNHAQLFSELLMCSTALGAGVVAPFARLYDQQGLIFAATVSDDFKSEMRRAAFIFYQSTSTTESALRRRIQTLESDVAADVPGAITQLADARAQLEAVRYPFCHDHAASQDLLLDMIKKARHKHVAMIDDQGFRLSLAIKHSTTLAKESSLLSLTMGHNVSQALFRVHGNGTHRNVHSAGNGNTPSFTYFSAPSSDLVQKLSEKLLKSATYSTLNGHAVIIDEEANTEAALNVEADNIVKLLETYYVLGHENDEKKARYALESPQLMEEWSQFLKAPNWLKILEVADNRSERAAKLISMYHVKIKVAAAFATRAALMQALIDNAGNPLVIQLRRQHFELALNFFKVLFRPMLRRLQSADRQADNAKKAREARSFIAASSERVGEIMETLRQAIEESPTGMLSRTQAVRLPKVSEALLDDIVKHNSEIVELVGSSNIKMGRTQRAYTLRSMIEVDVEEAIGDLQSACDTYAHDPTASAFDDMEIVRFELMRLAKAQDKGAFGLPAVPITKMSSLQIRCLPALLDVYKECFVMRGTSSNPEMPHLVKSELDQDAPLTEGIPTVWVRRDEKGKDFRDWQLAVKLGFADIWKTDTAE